MNIEQEREAFRKWLHSDEQKLASPNSMSWFEVELAEAAWMTRAARHEQPIPAEIPRDLLGGIVDQVFGSAIEDTTVIEDIYRVIACEFARRRIEGEGK